ncbi:unnamed protein product [Dibothriocephalus latus]|uniref:Endonuclease/exonuclease/phosphatase domain-containing protein n=1 Tax=Dibothriocephalus latus TaxID=60516 RepID=A0A3P7MPV0_DIBLA|nr:unnamed protein product [Dibothriocephalus latus]
MQQLSSEKEQSFYSLSTVINMRFGYREGYRTKVEEYCWLRIFLKNNYSLLVGCVYHPPNASVNYDLGLSRAFHAAANLNLKYCLIEDDFNLLDMKWFPPSGPSKFENILEAAGAGSRFSHQRIKHNGRDRVDGQGGGVAMHVKSELSVGGRTERITYGMEAIWLPIKAVGSQPLEAVTVYRPPRTDTDAECLLQCVREIGSRPDVLIMGDFNAGELF